MNKSEINQAYSKYNKMVSSIIWKKYSYRAINDYDDMYQIGSEALIKSLQTYDESKGNISTYLYQSVYNALKHLDVAIDNMGGTHYNKAVMLKNYIMSNPDMSFGELMECIW